MDNFGKSMQIVQKCIPIKKLLAKQLNFIAKQKKSLGKDSLGTGNYANGVPPSWRFVLPGKGNIKKQKHYIWRQSKYGKRF